MRAPVRATWHEYGDAELVELSFDPPLASLEAWSEETWRTAFAIDGATVARANRNGDSIVTLVPGTRLPRARRLEVELCTELTLADGAALAKGSRFSFTTPGPRVIAALPVRVEDDGDRVLRIAFDLPVGEQALEGALAVHDGDGTRLARSLAPIADSADREFDGAQFGLAEPDIPRDETGFAFEVTIPGDSGGPRDERVTLRLDSNLRSTMGPITLAGAREFAIDFQSPLAVEDVFARSDAIELDFGYELGPIDATLVSLEPSAPFVIARRWSGGIALEGSFEPGTRYLVRLERGFPGDGFARLADAVALPVTIPDRPPRVEFTDRAIVLSAHAKPEISVEGANVDAVLLRGKRVHDHNAVHFLRQRDGSWRADPDAAFSASYLATTVPVVARRNEEFRLDLDLTPVLGANPRGLFLLELSDPRRDAYPRHCLIAITDLRATFRVDGDSALASVASVETGEPIAGARVEILSRSNRRIGEAVTDPRGIAIFSCPSEPGDEAFCALASLGDDRTFVDLDHFRLADPSDDDSTREYLRRGEREAFVASDRPVVRPGESVSFAVALRDSRLRAAPGAFLVRCFDGAENRREEKRVEPRGSGLASFEIETQVADPTGVWRIELVEPDSDRRIGGATFQVAAVSLPRIEVEATIADSPTLGGRASAAIRAKWLSGAAVSGARAVVSARLDPPARPSDDAFETRSSGFLGLAIPAIETSLDADGAARVEFDLPDLSRLAGAQDAVLRIDAEVADPDGRIVSRRAETIARASGVRLGIARSGDSLDIRLLTEVGAPYSRDATVEIELATTHWTWRVNRSGGLAAVAERIVLLSEAVTIADGRGRFAPAVSLDRPGLVATARFEGRVVDLALTGDANPPDRLALTPPDHVIARGAEFPLEIDSPIAGDVLLSIEGGGIHAAERFTIEAGRTRKVVTLPDVELPPTVRLVATLARPQRDLGRDDTASILVGIARLAVDATGRVGIANVTTHETVEPGARVAIAISAEGAAEALVAAVDAGALYGVARPFGDPLEFFTASRRSSTLAADSAVSLRRDARFAPASRPGGDAPSDVLAALLENTGEDEAAVVSVQRVSLDASGHADAVIDLSAFDSYEGRIEIVVLAAGSDRLAVGRASTVVRAPLSARLSGPRLLRSGDRAEFTLVARNDTGSDAEVALEIACDGPLALTDDAPRAMRIATGESVALAIPVIVDAELRDLNEASIRVAARCAGYERAVVRGLRVSPRDPIVTRRESWAIVDVADTTRRIGAGMTGSMSIRIELSARPEARLAAAEALLADYPHGCTEQVASQVLARMAAVDFQSARPDGAERGGIAEFVTAGMRRLVAAQRPSGAFSFWPRFGAGDALPTIHACETLLVAADFGFVPPEGAIESAIGWLSRQGVGAEDIVLAATSAELISRAGRPIPEIARRAAASDSREARARAAIALARAGDRTSALAALTVEPRADGRSENAAIFPSSRRALALEVRAWLATAPGDATTHQLATRLIDDLAQPDSWTTHELAHGLLAAREYFRAFAAEVEARVGTIRCGESSRTFDTAREPIDWSFEAAPGATIEVNADGPVFGRLTTVGRQTGASDVTSSDLRIAREVRGLADDLPLLPGEDLRRGGSYRGVIRVEAARDFGPLVIIDPLPAGCEPERSIAVVSEERRDHDSDGESAAHVELRDGAAVFYFDRLAAGTHSIRYVFRAVSCGEFARPPARAAAMYEPDVVAESGASGEVSIRR